jgi:5-methylcytosine-specific restriction enzyme B
MSKYHPDRDPAPNLNAARRWADRCLETEGSIFADNENLWTPPLLDELDRLFIQNYDEGEGTFIQKLKDQLQAGSPESRKLMAESLWILMLFQSNASPEHKRETVREVWGWSGSNLNEKHPMLSDEVLTGLGSAGTAFNTLRWRELGYLLTLVRTFKRLSSDERAALLSDAWRFSKWLVGVPQIGNRQMRHILRYLLFPDSFERIASGRDKRAILAGFSGTPEREIRSWSDDEVDRKLLELRQRLEREVGTEIDFYRGELKDRWQKKPEVRTWLLSWNPERWHWESLAAVRQSTATGNLVTDRWSCASGQVKEGDQVYLVRVGTPPKGIVAHGTVLKAPYEAPHYDPTRAQAGETYSYIDVEFSGIRDAERDPIVPLEDLERAAPHQTWNPQASGIEIAPAAAKVASELWGRLPPLAVSAETRVADAQPSAAPRNLILYGPPGTGKTYRLLTSYVPSYGGRFVQAGSQLSSESNSGSIRRYEFVTFHQSYSYEDFVEGIRPTIGPNNSINYEVKPGVLRRLCERAKNDPSRRYALLIDEINRGNIAKIFGELITLMESDKRATYGPDGTLVSGVELTLPYSGEQFGVPANLDIYGTMNTADRSIALLDVALRRRFEFEELVPTPAALTGKTGDGRIEDGEGGEIDLRCLLEVINKRLTHLLHRDQTIGHSYLMHVRDFPTLRRVLSREIIPLLQEYFYEDWKRIRMVLADHTVPAEHQLVRSTVLTGQDLFFAAEDEGLTEAIHYVVAPEAEITPEAVREIYEQSE